MIEITQEDVDRRRKLLERRWRHERPSLSEEELAEEIEWRLFAWDLEMQYEEALVDVHEKFYQKFAQLREEFERKRKQDQGAECSDSTNR